MLDQLVIELSKLLYYLLLNIKVVLTENPH